MLLSRTQKSIDQAKLLVHNGRYDEAWQIVEAFEKEKAISLKDQFTSILLGSQIKSKMGYYEEGLTLAKQALNKSQELNKPLQKIDAYVAMAETLGQLQRFDESLEILDQGERLLQKVGEEPIAALNQRKADLLHIKGRNLRQKGDIDQALAPLEKSLALREELGDKREIAESLSSIGRYYSRIGDMKQALRCFEQSLKLLEEDENKWGISQGLWNVGSIFCQQGNLTCALEYFEKSRITSEEIGYKQGIAQALFCSGAMYRDMGELDHALKYQKQNLELFKELDKKSEIAASFTQAGFIYLSRGELDRALDYHEKSLVLYEKLGNKYQSAWALIGIGESYRQRGELDRALTYFEQSLRICKESGDREDIAGSLYYISKIFHQQSKLDQALANLEQSLDTYKDLSKNLSMAGVLLEMVSVAINKQSLDQATKYLWRLEQINDQEENRIINQHYRLAKALVLKTSSRLRDKARAQEIFQQIVEEEVVKHQLTVMAMFNLCESLLDELKAYGEVDVLLEAKNLAEKITTLAQHQSSLFLNVHASILKAKFAMVEGDLSTAEKFLDQAKKTAEEKGLDFLVAKVSLERQNLEEQYDTWLNLIQNNATFKERLKKAELKDYIREALRLARANGDHKTCE